MKKAEKENKNCLASRIPGTRNKTGSSEVKSGYISGTGTPRVRIELRSNRMKQAAGYSALHEANLTPLQLILIYYPRLLD